MSMNCDAKNSEVLSILDVELILNITIIAWQFLPENATGDEHKKLKISWKSLTNFLVQLTNFENFVNQLATKSLTKKILVKIMFSLTNFLQLVADH